MLGKIGILGFGIVGKSYLKLLSFRNNISIWDNRNLTQEELELAASYNASVVKTDLHYFFKTHDHILVSPGIDIRQFKSYYEKCSCELDFFAEHFSSSSIAITGTLGKTSITRLLGQAFAGSNLNKVGIGGNIGYPMLGLLEQGLNLAVLELSSFQLDLSKKFAPDIAIISNFYPNHLDRHDDTDAYLSAKLKIFQYQNKDQHAIVPVDLILQHKLPEINSKVSVVCTRRFDGDLGSYNLFHIRDGQFLFNDTVLYNLDDIPRVTFLENMLFIISALHLLGLSKEGIGNRVQALSKKEVKVDPHRVEFFASFNGVDFYNDSKATVVEATFAALDKLCDRPIVLIIGGLSKGVERGSFMSKIKKRKNLKDIVCFGKECSLFSGCLSYQTLDEAVFAAINLAAPGDQVLFSPGGASFDLFANFGERGESFKWLVENYGRKSKLDKKQSKIFTSDC